MYQRDVFVDGKKWVFLQLALSKCLFSRECSCTYSMYYLKPKHSTKFYFWKGWLSISLATTTCCDPIPELRKHAINVLTLKITQWKLSLNLSRCVSLYRKLWVESIHTTFFSTIDRVIDAQPIYFCITSKCSMRSSSIFLKFTDAAISLHIHTT